MRTDYFDTFCDENAGNQGKTYFVAFKKVVVHYARKELNWWTLEN